MTQAQIAAALDTFKSVRRRVEVRGEVNGVTVIDDFAHHPTAVRETLKALRQRYTGQRIIAVFEPRSWSSRLAVFQDDYVRAFQAADYIVLAQVFNTAAASALGETLDTGELTAAIAATGQNIVTLPDADAIVAHLAPQARPGDIIAIMSNGGFGGIHDKMLAALR